jgi:hypothetical protein
VSARQLVHPFDNATGELCPWCGDVWSVELLEAWPEERAFMLDACCALADAEAVERLATDKHAARAVLGWFGARRLVQDLDFLRVDYGLTVELRRGPDDWRELCAFVDEHHRHHDKPTGWKWGHVVRNGPDVVGVAMVGRPVGRWRPDRAEGIVEVNRCAAREDLAPGLAFNACSMLYGAAFRRAMREGYDRVITYTLASEHGASLRAAGFRIEAKVRGRSWSCKSRPRSTPAKLTVPKLRWARYRKGMA